MKGIMIKAIAEWSLSVFEGLMMTEVSTPFPECVKNNSRVNRMAAKILAKSVIYAFAIFGVLFILLLLAVLGLLRQEMTVQASIPSAAYLAIDFDDKYNEVRGDTLLTELSETSPVAFYDVIRAINTAAEDERIKVLVGRISSSPLGLAQIQNLRSAVKNFRVAGKKAYIFAEGFGSFGNGTSEYYLASAFDEIWMQPHSEAGITGISMEVPFLRGLLDKWGIFPEFYARYEYKTAAASLTDKQMPSLLRQELQKTGRSIFGQIVKDIHLDRKIAEKKLSQLIDEAPLSAQKAQQSRLVDVIGYEQQLLEQFKKNDKLEEVELFDYVYNLKNGHKGNPEIAVLVAEGEINSGRSTENPLRGELSIGAASVMKQLEEIAENKNIKALVLRINSPGGSFTASDEIWFALEKLKRERKMPLIVSMGNYAASGGYYIALAGDKLLAEPSTITGSIGVLGGKIVLGGLWDKLGVQWNEVKFGRNAGILSSAHKFSAEEKTLFNKSLDGAYESFTLKVSQARNIPQKDLNSLARGRIWTGEDAVKVNLIDALGGLDQAIDEARLAAGIADGQSYRVVYFPKPKTLQEKISDVLKSAPLAVAQKVKAELGIDSEDMALLRRMRHELVLVPFKMNF